MYNTYALILYTHQIECIHVDEYCSYLPLGMENIMEKVNGNFRRNDNDIVSKIITTDFIIYTNFRILNRLTHTSIS